jgi:dihydroflavonol-4-reductase
MITLVTGATGLLGNNVARLLIQRGERVRVLVRDPDDRSLAGLPLDVVRGDVCDTASVRRAAQGVDRIIHAAARVHLGWTGLDLHRSVNVEGTHKRRSAVGPRIER